MAEEIKQEEQPTPEPTKEEIVRVKKGELNSILTRLDKQDAELLVLREVADKSRLAWWEEKHKKPLVSITRLSVIENKVIVGWKTVVDEVYQDASRIWHERQIIEVFFEDETSQKLNYLDFVRLTKKIEAEVKSRIKDEVNGTEVLKVETKEGKQYDIDIRFVN